MNKGTTQGSVSGPHLFILFINELGLENCPDASLSKYADETTMQVIVHKAGTDCGQLQTICLAMYPSVKN